MRDIIVNFVKSNIMGAAELRKKLHNYIDQADETFLKMVHAMSKEYKSSVVGYNPDGTPITQQDLRTRVKAASKRVKSGDYITQEEVEKEVENW
jgi:predicted ribonuclease YlaK